MIVVKICRFGPAAACGGGGRTGAHRRDRHVSDSKPGLDAYVGHRRSLPGLTRSLIAISNGYARLCLGLSDTVDIRPVCWVEYLR